MSKTVYVVRYDHGDYGQGIEGVYTQYADACRAVLDDIRAQDYPLDHEVDCTLSDPDNDGVSVFRVADDYWYVEAALLWPTMNPNADKE